MSIFAKIKNLFSTRFSTCMYAIFGAVSLIVFSSLFIWAMQGVSATESSILSATVITDGSVRKEYSFTYCWSWGCSPGVYASSPAKRGLINLLI